MQIGFVGLGKMGLNMVTRLVAGGHEVIAHARHETSVDAAKAKGAIGAYSLEELVEKLNAPRTIWLMIPAEVTAATAQKLSAILELGDTIIDGGNSFYKNSIKLAQELTEKGIGFVDVGTSGGLWGLESGYCLSIGGKKEQFEALKPVFETLATKGGYGYLGDSGAGHFVKMVHNGIEYAMLQAYGEGFEIIQAKKEFNIDLAKLSRVWNHGSVIRSWLLELAEKAFSEDPQLDSVLGYVEDSGEGRWAVAEAIAEDVPAPVITLSLMERFQSRLAESFSAKLVAALRKKFGGHEIKGKD